MSTHSGPERVQAPHLTYPKGVALAAASVGAIAVLEARERALVLGARVFLWPSVGSRRRCMDCLHLGQATGRA